MTFDSSVAGRPIESGGGLTGDLVPGRQGHASHVAILGAPVTSGNRGVLALGSSLVSLFLDASPTAQLRFMVAARTADPVRILPGERRRLVEVVNYRLSPRSSPREHFIWIVTAAILYKLIPVSTVRRGLAASAPWVKALSSSGIVGDVRGGDSFSDIYGMMRYVIGSLRALTVLAVHGDLVQLPQTYGPFKSRTARVMARFILRRSSTILARDRESQRVAQQLVGPDKKVLLSPDVAFSLEPIIPDELELDPPLADQLQVKSLRSKVTGGIPTIPTAQLSTSDLRPSTAPAPAGVIGLNVNGLMYNGGYTRNNQFGLKLDYANLLPDLVTALLREHPGELWLIPHTYGPPESVESDPAACRRVRATLPVDLQDRVRIVTSEYDCHEIKGIIGLCDFFVGSRMHACIAALSQGVPCVGVAYSMKFRGVFESVGMEDWVIDGRTTTRDQAIERVVELYRRRENVREPLAHRADVARTRLTEVFRDLFAKAG